MITCPFIAPAFLNFPTNKKCSAMFNQTACQYFAMDIHCKFCICLLDKYFCKLVIFLDNIFVVVPDMFFFANCRCTGQHICKQMFLAFFLHLFVLFNLIVQIIVIELEEGLLSQVWRCLQKMFQIYFPILCVVKDRWERDHIFAI